MTVTVLESSYEAAAEWQQRLPCFRTPTAFPAVGSDRLLNVRSPNEKRDNDSRVARVAFPASASASSIVLRSCSHNDTRKPVSSAY